MRRLPFTITTPFDDDLVASVGETVQGTVAQGWVVEEAKPLLYRPLQVSLNIRPKQYPKSLRCKMVL